MTDRDQETIPPPSKERRWDIDTRGVGVADARTLAPRIAGLLEVAEQPNWVTEEPDAHLWPHIERDVTAAGSTWRAAHHAIDHDGRLVVDLVHEPVDGDRGRAVLQADVLRLLGLVIEGATFVVIEEHRDSGEVILDVVTGMLDDQTAFKGHGHTLRFRARMP
jgi:hypothetical protein